MVGIMNGGWREKAASLTNSAKYAMEIPSKLEHLRQLKEILMQRDPSLLSELVPQLFEFQADRSSPVRKFLAEMIGEIGLKHMDYVPEIVPVLMALFKDDAPAVARQAIASGTAIFRCTLERVAIQGLSTSKLDDILESSWAWMLKLKDTVYSIAFQPGNDGMRLLAVKFVEAIVLLYTPDPNGYSEPPPNHAFDGQLAGFNITWLRGGHPVLNVTDLSIEASQSLGLLLDQLRFPAVKSLSNPFIIVLINSVSSIAKKRPAFYGRILPVLLGLYPSCSLIEGVHGPGVHHALKNAFLSCFKCTHPGAVPWRDRLVGALEEMKAGGLAEQPICQVDNSKGSLDAREEEQKPSVKACDATSIDPRRKRSMVQDISDVVQDDDVSGKRARPTLSSEASTKDIHKDTDIIQDSFPSTGLTTSGDEGDTGPVQQLVAMFGALVAQGDKAAKSLEILISSISAELLAEVVIANLRYLPPDRPKAEEDQEPILNMGSCSSMDGGDSLVKQMPSFLSHLLSLSSAFPQITCLIDDQQSVSLDGSDTQWKDRHQAAPEAESSLVCASVNDVTQAVVSSPSEMEKGTLAIPSDVHIMGNLEGQIPGLESTTSSSGLPNALETSHLSFVDLEGLNQEQVSSLSVKSQPDVLPFGSMSIDKSEERSPKVSVADTCSTISMTPYILPKMSAPVINLSDEQKDQLQKLVFLRIIEAYKQITVAGGSDFRFSLLAYLAVEYPLELDPWKLLQKHILSDYSNHEGHELTVRVLYRLFGEAEEEQDFFSSTTATSVYETFLLSVKRWDSFPASDKSLSRLFGEAPYLPKAAFRLLECLCCPGDKAKIEKELQSGDRVTQGLSAVWSLILLRPPIRDACLKIALQSAAHPLEEVRMKAIRLVANKLYSISSIAQQIEDYANEMLLSVLNGVCAKEGMDMEGSTVELRKDSDLEKPSNENTLVNSSTKEISSDNQSGSVQSTSSSSISEAQRCTSLYFALCTKKHSLFRQIFVIYKSIPTAVKQAVHRHIPVLVRTIGASADLLGIISDPPTGSEGLLLQVIHTLTDGATPSLEIIYAVRRLYDLKLKDVEVLIPVLSFLPKDEVLQIFPQLVNLPQDRFQVALARILQGLSHSDQVVSPTEVLIAIHGIDPDKDGIPLKKVTDACNACFEQREVFTQQVLAKVLNQLVEQIPLPLLFMRTVLQAIGAFPALVDFIMEILSLLVSKQIWKYPKLWVGFLKCALLTKPQSFSVLLQLPAPQLENALNRTAALKAPLIAHANQPNIRSTLPRSTLVVLGISPDSQTSSQAQTTQAVTEDAVNSGTEVSTEKAKESSNAS